MVIDTSAIVAILLAEAEAEPFAKVIERAPARAILLDAEHQQARDAVEKLPNRRSDVSGRGWPGVAPRRERSFLLT